jgi:hypothetical protein
MIHLTSQDATTYNLQSNRQGLLFPNLVLLFYPVSRGSILLQAAGLSYPSAIRYHRWLGHWVMVRLGLFWVGGKQGEKAPIIDLIT